MPRVFQIFLNIHRPVTKRFFCFHFSGEEFFGERYSVVRNAHSSAATSGYRFDYDRKPNFFGYSQSFLLIFYRSVASRNNRNSRLRNSFSSKSLVPHLSNGFRTWTNEKNVTGFTLLREVGVFREKSVSGMDGVHIRYLSCTHDPVSSQIAFSTCGRTNANGFVCKLDVKRLFVGFGIDSNCPYA